MLLAQLTDLHVVDPTIPIPPSAVCDTNQRLAMAIASLLSETVAPDALLLTGDLVDDATEASMAHLIEALTPFDSLPILAIPGNHDDRALFRSAFDQPYQSPDHLGWVVDLGPVTIIGLDTVDPGQSSGLFDPQREQWLARALAATTGQPVAIAMHHPPFHTGITNMDRIGLGRLDAFRSLITAHQNRHNNLTRIFCGHLHRPIITTTGGVTTTVGISTVQSVTLDLTPNPPFTISDEPAGYSLHLFTDPSWVTHTRYIHPSVSSILI